MTGFVGNRLDGRRVLITSAHTYMGPAIRDLFESEGATVTANEERLAQPGACEDAVASAGEVDVLVANLAERESLTWDFAENVTNSDWTGFFDDIVHPLMRLTRAVLPQMISRRAGKIVAVTSAAPLRGIPKASAYCSARGAQNAYVRAVGLEVARHNVQFNAIAQNYIENPTYYSDEMLADEDLMKRMLKVIPARGLGKGSETAELALFLASENSNFIVGQIVPFAGGWTTTTG